MATTCLHIRFFEVVLDEDSMLIFIFIQVLLCQGDVWKYKHLEKDLKIAFDEFLVVREGCTFAKVPDNGEYQSLTLAVC